MTKLEELKAAYAGALEDAAAAYDAAYRADAAYDAYGADAAYDAAGAREAYAYATLADEAADDAYAAYQAELNKAQEEKDNKMQVCPQCHGDCMVYTDVPASGGYDSVYERCETCDAEGVVEIDEAESLQ